MGDDAIFAELSSRHLRDKLLQQAIDDAVTQELTVAMKSMAVSADHIALQFSELNALVTALEGHKYFAQPKEFVIHEEPEFVWETGSKTEP